MHSTSHCLKYKTQVACSIIWWKGMGLWMILCSQTYLSIKQESNIVELITNQLITLTIEAQGSSWCHLWSLQPGSCTWDICITTATSVGCVSCYTCRSCLVSRSLLPQTKHFISPPLSRKRRILFFHMYAPAWDGVTIFCDYRGTSHPHNHSGKMFPVVDVHNTFKKHLCQGSHIMLHFLYYLICLSLKVSAVPNVSQLFDRRLKIVMPGFLEAQYYHMTTHSTKCAFAMWNLNAAQLIFSLFNRLLFWHIFPPPYHIGKKTGVTVTWKGCVSVQAILSHAAEQWFAIKLLEQICHDG